MKKIKNLLFPDYFKKFSDSKKIAIIGLVTALNVVANAFFEFKLYDIQYSLTCLFSVFSGLILGPLYGFISCVLADAIGFFINNGGGIYMFWVALSTGIMAVISGLLFKNTKKTSQYIVKCFILCVLILLVCTIGINTTGFYFYNKLSGFQTAFINYATEQFGGKQTYICYTFYRLFFKFQILNSIFNYALIFLLVPIVDKLLIQKYFNVKQVKDSEEKIVKDNGNN